jgi:hypothetical protein
MADKKLLFVGTSSMGWRNKLLIVLIVYFAGFATAIYSLAPASTEAAGPTEPNQPKSFPHSFLNSNDFAMAFSSGMRNCINAGSYAADYIKQKLASDKGVSKTVSKK